MANIALICATKDRTFSKSVRLGFEGDFSMRGDLYHDGEHGFTKCGETPD
jgi:hypothetical protein